MDMGPHLSTMRKHIVLCLNCACASLYAENVIYRFFLVHEDVQTFTLTPDHANASP